MLKTPFFHLSAVFAVIMLVVISGCAGKSQPPQFYTLTSIAEGNIFPTCDNPARNAAIGIGPVKLADYLDQSRIVTRTSDNRVEQAEFDKWSGSFKDNLTNVLAENIGHLLATDRIAIYPWRSYVPIDYHVTVDIVRCDGQPGKEVILVARWRVLSGNEKKTFAMKRSDIHEQAGNGGYEGLVAAQSRALGRLSLEIVQAIQAAAREQQTGK
jgi:uncharacterized lipoprotein YmbA